MHQSRLYLQYNSDLFPPHLPPSSGRHLTSNGQITRPLISNYPAAEAIKVEHPPSAGARTVSGAVPAMLCASPVIIWRPDVRPAAISSGISGAPEMGHIGRSGAPRSSPRGHYAAPAGEVWVNSARADRRRTTPRSVTSRDHSSAADWPAAHRPHPAP